MDRKPAFILLLNKFNLKQIKHRSSVYSFPQQQNYNCFQNHFLISKPLSLG